MDQLWSRVLLERQAVEHAVDMVSQSASTLSRQSRWLVQDNDGFVHVENGVLKTSRCDGGGFRLRFLFQIAMNDLRRQANQLAGRNPVRRLHPLAIEADLSGPEQFLETAMCQRRVMPFEPAVDTDSVLVVSDAGGLGHQIERTSHMPANNAKIERIAEPDM